MIRYCEELPPITADCFCLARILSLYRAYAGSAIKNDFWMGRTGDAVTCLLARSGGCLTVYTNGHDPDELRDFIQVISPGEIVTDADTAKALNLPVAKTASVLYTDCESMTDTDEPVGLLPLYEGLRLGADGDIDLPPFSEFAADVSHRLRHDAAKAVLHDNGAALCFLFEGGGILNGIAVHPHERSKGVGSRILTEILGLTGGRVFVCCTESTLPFYVKNHFISCGSIASCKIG